MTTTQVRVEEELRLEDNWRVLGTLLSKHLAVRVAIGPKRNQELTCTQVVDLRADPTSNGSFYLEFSNRQSDSPIFLPSNLCMTRQGGGVAPPETERLVGEFGVVPLFAKFELTTTLSTKRSELNGSVDGIFDMDYESNESELRLDEAVRTIDNSMIAWHVAAFDLLPIFDSANPATVPSLLSGSLPSARLSPRHRFSTVDIEWDDARRESDSPIERHANFRRDHLASSASVSPQETSSFLENIDGVFSQMRTFRRDLRELYGRCGQFSPVVTHTDGDDSDSATTTMSGVVKLSRGNRDESFRMQLLRIDVGIGMNSKIGRELGELIDAVENENN